MGDSNRGAWIIAGAILLAAGLIVGTLLYLRSQDAEARCDELRSEIQGGGDETSALALLKYNQLDCKGAG